MWNYEKRLQYPVNIKENNPSGIIFYSNYYFTDDLKETINRNFINDRIDLKLASTDEQEEIINKVKTYNKIGNFKIQSKNTLDGLKLYLEDESWILIRKSGTEPLLRIYFETDKEEKLVELQNNVRELC